MRNLYINIEETFEPLLAFIFPFKSLCRRQRDAIFHSEVAKEYLERDYDDCVIITSYGEQWGTNILQSKFKELGKRYGVPWNRKMETEGDFTQNCLNYLFGTDSVNDSLLELILAIDKAGDVFYSTWFRMVDSFSLDRVVSYMVYTTVNMFNQNTKFYAKLREKYGDAVKRSLADPAILSRLKVIDASDVYGLGSARLFREIYGRLK